MLKKAFVSALCVLALPATANTAPGPFGLDWGVTPEEVRNAGVVTTPHKSFSNISAHGASRLPQGHAYGKAYSLMFDADFGLQRVTLISEAISGDRDGAEGKIQYSLLKKRLTKQYGEPIAHIESAGEAFRLLPHEFYPCIAISDCGHWMTVFNGPGSAGRIVLEMHGISTGTGYLTVTHEGPLWFEQSSQVPDVAALAPSHSRLGTSLSTTGG